MARIVFTEEQKQALKRERFAHPHPRVQKRMDVMWYLSLGETNANAAGPPRATHVRVVVDRGVVCGSSDCPTCVTFQLHPQTNCNHR
jgi:hypothetical protein